jgi:hypothetical protein
VNSGFPGKLREVTFEAAAIDEGRSGSLIEFGRASWPLRYRLSIHSDPAAIVGYGVFRPLGLNRRSNDDGLADHLSQVRGGVPTPERLWAWHRKMDAPLRDFSQRETLLEVDKLRRREPARGGAVFQRASDDLISLARALDQWYSQRRAPTDAR